MTPEKLILSKYILLYIYFTLIFLTRPREANNKEIIQNLHEFFSWVGQAHSLQILIVGQEATIHNNNNNYLALSSQMQFPEDDTNYDWKFGDLENNDDTFILFFHCPANISISNLIPKIHRKRSNRNPFYFLNVGNKTPAQITQEMETLCSDGFRLLNLKSHVYIIFNSLQPIDIYELYCIKSVFILQPMLISKAGFLETYSPIVFRRQNFHSVKVPGLAQKIDFSNIVGAGDVWAKHVNGTLQFGRGYNNVEEYRYLRDALNFTEVNLAGKGFVKPGPNRTLTGIGLQIQQREADISTISSEFLPYRLEQLTFLHPTSEEALSIYFQQIPLSSIRDIYSQPFGLRLWLVSLQVWIAIIISFFIVFYIRRKFKFPEIPFSKEVMLWSFSTFCQQGWYTFPKPGPIRIAIASSLITGIVLYNGYCAALVSILSTPANSINSFQDILANRFTIYTDVITLAAKDMLKSLNESNQLGPDDPKGDSREIRGDQGIFKIIRSKSAFIAPPYAFYPFALPENLTENDMCLNVARLRIGGPPNLSGMFVRKRSEFQEPFNYKILQLYERGIRSALNERFWKQIQLPCLDTRSPTRSFDITDALSTIILMSAGIVCSFIGFLVELFFWAKSNYVFIRIKKRALLFRRSQTTIW